MRRLLTAILVSGGLMFAAAAHADTFTLTGNGSGGSGSATLTATNNNNGTFTVTGISNISAVIFGQSVSGLSATVLAPNPTPFGQDDLLFFGSGAPYFDSKGLAFRVSVPGDNTFYNVDLTGDMAGNYFANIIDSDGSQTGPNRISLSVAATPEPSSLVLLGTGVLGIGGALRRRMRKAA